MAETGELEKMAQLDFSSADNVTGFMPVEELPLMASPWPNAVILVGYLYFVLRLGPRLMQERTPFDLKNLIIVYNLAMVILSSWILIKAQGLSRGYFYAGHCQPSSLPVDVYDGLTVVTWVYFFSKSLELLDTVFFVLRRKMNQVTLLHVYHHANMSMITWFYMKYLPASQIQMAIQSNSFVHILMYGYYFLAAMGPSLQKYLWWKKYLTRIQIIQLFAIIGFYVSLLLAPACRPSAAMTWLTIGNTFSFLVLFILYYSKTYRNKQKTL